MIVEFESVSASLEGTVIKVETDSEAPDGYYYFGNEYMDEFEGGEFDLNAGTPLPDELDTLPDGEQDALRNDLFQEEDDGVDGESDE